MRSLLCLVVVSGCSSPGPRPNWTGAVRIVPVVVTNAAGETRWTEDQIKKGIEEANDYWEDMGIEFKMSDTIKLKSDSEYEQAGVAGFTRMLTRGRSIAKAKDAYPVFFVNKITWTDRSALGMSTSANAPVGFQYGTAVSAVARNRTGPVLAHELGHAWGLAHSWSDKHSDTTSSGPDDCNPGITCNVMSYCSVKPDCTPLPFFSKQQIASARKWALSSSRVDFLETDHVMIMSVLPLSDELIPIVDFVDDWK